MCNDEYCEEWDRGWDAGREYAQDDSHAEHAKEVEGYLNNIQYLRDCLEFLAEHYHSSESGLTAKTFLKEFEKSTRRDPFEVVKWWNKK